MATFEEVRIVAEWWDDGSRLLERSRVAEAHLAEFAVPGLPASTECVVQIAECRVGERRVAVINPTRLQNDDDRKNLIARLSLTFGPAVIAYQLSASDGVCDLDDSLLEAGQAPFAAMAAAVIKASWGWDESPEIRVQIGLSAVRVTAVFQPGKDGRRRWVAKAQ